MSKRESELKSAFSKELAKQLPNFYVFHYATAGAPDRSIIGAGVQSNWEMKHGTPDFASPDNQALICTRMAVQGGHCRYVIWQEHKGLERTLIAHPRDVLERKGWGVHAEASCPGFDHKWLCAQIRKAHGI